MTYEKGAVLGNTGGGQSTLVRTMANITGLPLNPIDSIRYQAGGEEIPHIEYLEIHAGLLQKERWIIDGFGCVASAWKRFAAALSPWLASLYVSQDCRRRGVGSALLEAAIREGKRIGLDALFLFTVTS
ncbi:MAG: GNAT family N-acetyltransferase, partial [Nitrospirae bacterium]|nr:GNAT family N-acetyltransferase [Nitrospirota bacterium]